MPTENKDAKEIVGAVMCEEPGTGFISLNIYTSSLDSIEKERLDFPQQPVQQTYIVNYPILAYKSMTPDNKEISIVHLAQDIP